MLSYASKRRHVCRKNAQDLAAMKMKFFAQHAVFQGQTKWGIKLLEETYAGQALKLTQFFGMDMIGVFSEGKCSRMVLNYCPVTT